MASASGTTATRIDSYLRQQHDKQLLRFFTCGSVDDGKSSLIGRLLYESKALFDDQLAAVRTDSRRWGTQGDDLDLALLVDGLAAEREQGITIDVAYRFFSTERRKFIVADTPGHEQYTRNMATGASTADAAVILVDARKGVLTQTRRHSYIASLLGIRHVALAINKMDLVDYSRSRFDEIVREYQAFARGLSFASVTPIPLSALRGDNVVRRSEAMHWYDGPTLLELLETVEVEPAVNSGSPLRMPVQWVNRANADFRGFTGTIASGTVRPGDTIRVLPSGRQGQVDRIVLGSDDLDCAVAGQSVTLTLRNEIDISRGDVVCSAQTPCGVARQFEANMVWMQDEALQPGRHYLMKIGAKTVPMTVSRLEYRVDINTLEHLEADSLELNGVGLCHVDVDVPIAFDPYADNRHMGAFIVIDRLTNATAGAGMLKGALRRAQNIHVQHLDVDKSARAIQKRQKPGILWFTGLSGAGKSTLANLVERKLHAMGRHTYLLDGDNIRHGLNKDLGFGDADRVENIRRIAEVSRLMVDAGLIVLSAFISPFRSDRAIARALAEDGEFIEIHVDTPLAIAEGRDPKGLYAKARRGELRQFTGIDSPYEAPLDPELRLDGASPTPEHEADRVIEFLTQRGWLSH